MHMHTRCAPEFELFIIVAVAVAAVAAKRGLFRSTLQRAVLERVGGNRRRQRRRRRRWHLHCAFAASTKSTSQIQHCCCCCVWWQFESNFCSINHSPYPHMTLDRLTLPPTKSKQPSTHAHTESTNLLSNVDKTHFKLFRIALFCLVS